jgi:peptidoglycan/xylan/chitin deacetylase (PgdA/CDA1 family)
MTIVATLLASLAPPLAFGAGAAAVFGRAAAHALPGLLFHSIRPRRSLALSVVSRTQLETIILALKTRAFAPVTLSGGAELLRGGDPVSAAAKPMLLTFDDGCRSFYTEALPVLESAGFKATIFPVAGFLGSSSSWDVMPRFDHLTKEEVREISSLGHEIGSHSLTHPNLTYLDAADLAKELADSKMALEDITGKSVTAISFPFGSWNTRVWQRARELGYTHGTLYRNHAKAAPGLFPVYGVYGFDSPSAVLSRLLPPYPLSLSVACAKMMSHFAKGAPLWKFRKNYHLSAL